MDSLERLAMYCSDRYGFIWTADCCIRQFPGHSGSAWNPHVSGTAYRFFIWQRKTYLVHVPLPRQWNFRLAGQTVAHLLQSRQGKMGTIFRTAGTPRLPHADQCAAKCRACPAAMPVAAVSVTEMPLNLDSDRLPLK